ncbi:MAG TPA: hypothetical protein HPP87_05605 [Planctomycetes bacterium]|nr:hypothetical protein [Planctomycetota bacterium]
MIQNPDTASGEPQKRFGYFVVGFSLFIAAFGLRCYRLTQPPLDFHPMRQGWSLILARAYYFEYCDSVPEWQRKVAQVNEKMTHIKEPPIMEHLTALAYRFAGAERLWIPRMFSIISWWLGGLFLFLLARKIVSTDGALVCTAFYLFAPFGVFMSRSFQPEAMMVMLFIAGVLMIRTYYYRPSMTRLLVAAGLSSLAILVKFIAVFPIMAAFIFTGVDKQGLRKGLLNIRSILFFLSSLLLGTGYYFYMTFGPGHLRHVADTIFLPQLLLELSFWTGWLQVVGRTIGYAAVIAGLLGIVLLKNRSDKALLIGLWAGYVIYALLFTYTTATHDYYQVLLLPIVALSLGPTGSIIVAHLRHLDRRWRWGIAFFALFVIATLVHTGLNVRHDQFRKLDPAVKNRLRILCNFIGLNPHNFKRINYDFEQEIAVARRIGEIVNHSTRTIFLARDYGYPLRYYGQLSGVSWPRQKDLEARKARGLGPLNVQNRFEALTKKWSPEFFIVAELEEFRLQKDLKQLLINRFGVVAETDKYLIFDLTKEIGSNRQDNSSSSEGGSRGERLRFASKNLT